MLENFRFEEAARVDLSEAYAVYFISKEPFTADDADLFERLTGGRKVEDSLRETDSKKEDLLCLTLGAEIDRTDGRLLSLTISPSTMKEDLCLFHLQELPLLMMTDIDPCDITVDREETIQWLRAYAESHKENDNIPRVLAKIHENT